MTKSTLADQMHRNKIVSYWITSSARRAHPSALAGYTPPERLRLKMRRSFRPRRSAHKAERSGASADPAPDNIDSPKEPFPQ